MTTNKWKDENFVSFTLNGQIQNVSSAPGNISLNTYIREYAKLKGTKFMCREGGCGICVVSLQFTHPVTGQERTVSVNSCMFPLYACHGYKITTTEGIGSRKNGYNEIQSRLAHFYGSQCGYCTPGWVMSMYSLLSSNPNATMQEIEDSFSGNLCRCTGYRPILDAFKSFASDRSRDLEKKVADIEDVLKVCKKSGTICNRKCKKDKDKQAPYDCVNKAEDDFNDIEFLELAFASQSLRLEFLNGSKWYKVSSVNEIFQVLGMISGSYMLVGGNTAQGILKGQAPPNVFIDINGVAYLKQHWFESNQLYVGANTTLADAIVLFKAVAQENPSYFSYTSQLAKHIEKVANTHVRNVGTLAGNLSLKHQYRAFQSDIFLILETVGARLMIRRDEEAVNSVSLPEFLEMDMYKKVLLQIVLPPLDCNSYVVKTYKIAPRAQNAVAYVNGGFKFKINRKNRFKVLELPSIVFGNITPAFIHACSTEQFLVGKKLLNPSTLKNAIQILSKEVTPDLRLPEASPEYRAALTQALLYRAILSLDPSLVNAKLRIGGEDITRPLSSGKQEYDSDTSRPPLYQPIPKMDALLQCSGEAEYTFDIPTIGDLYAALVITKCGPAELVSLDPSEALKMQGVVTFYSARDIPGENTFISIQDFSLYPEELFVSKDILHAGQPVGVVIAETQELADAAAELVKITYKNQRKPVLDVREVVESKDESRIILREERNATAPKDNVKKVIKGDFKTDTQYHFPMELLTCVVHPTEEGLDVVCSSQWLQSVQETVALLLNLQQNKVNVKLLRVGGAYGLKITRANIASGACSLAAYLLQRPVRMMMKLETVMEAIGKRWPCYFTYEVGIDDEGEVQYLTSQFYEDAGSAYNDSTIPYAIIAYSNIYDETRMSVKMYDVKTDKACTVWTRAPGTLEAVVLTEHIMEHIAHELNKDPLTIRLKNLNKTYPVEAMIETLKNKSDFETRKAAVEQFNTENALKKRGISLMPMRFPMLTECNYHAMISVFRNDGTVAVVHGGVELGQGVNVKAAQVCASALGIPLNLVAVKPTNTLICPNDGLTGGSFTTDSICYAVEYCCQELNKRLQPVREKLDSPTWQQLIQSAYSDQVDLNVTYMFSPKTDKVSYQIFGVIVLEVEIDILTGEHKVIRVDILEDAGKSLNQFVDVGQIEGAFIMGLGFFTSEEQIHDPDTGRVLTNRTLKYKIPGAKDIPIDFRVYILKNGDNPLGILRSKAIGEPPICLSISVMFAIRQALRSARKDFGLPDDWLQMNAPFTAENIFRSSGINAEKYSL